MKKFFAVLLMAAAMFSAAQIVEPVTAYAKDVWIASDERCHYYVMTETFKYRYADTKGFSIDVKFVTADNSFVGGVEKSQSRLFELGNVSSGRG